MTILSSATNRLRKRRQASASATIQGWGTKVKHGFARRRWLTLVGCVIFFAPSDTAAPRGHINLAEAKVTLHDASADSDPEASDEDNDDATRSPGADAAAAATAAAAAALHGRARGLSGGAEGGAALGSPASRRARGAQGAAVSLRPTAGPGAGRYCLQLSTAKAEYNLLFPTRNERSRWAHFCAAVTGESTGGTGTLLERRVRRIVADAKPRLGSMDERRDRRRTAQLFPADDVFSHPELRPHGAPPLKAPLTTLPTVEADAAALALNSDICLFTTVEQPQQSEQLAYHIKLAQGIVARALQHKELRDELLAQLVVETNAAVDAVTGKAPYSVRQAWQLLALTCPLFPPSKLFSRCDQPGQGAAPGRMRMRSALHFGISPRGLTPPPPLSLRQFPAAVSALAVANLWRAPQHCQLLPQVPRARPVQRRPAVHALGGGSRGHPRPRSRQFFAPHERARVLEQRQSLLGRH